MNLIYFEEKFGECFESLINLFIFINDNMIFIIIEI